MSEIREMSEINVDVHELSKFAEIAHRWWDPAGELRTLHQINPLRLNWIRHTSPLAGKQVLDVGCGGGILSESMAQHGARVLGIDLGAKALCIARLHAQEAQVQNLEYREVSVEQLAGEQTEAFDIVTCMEMLEHVPNPASVVSACAALVKPGGWVFFSTINRSFKAFMLTIVAAEYLLNLLPRGTHAYAKLIRPSELATYCRTAGLQIEKTAGLTYSVLAQSYRLTQDTGANYFLAARKPSHT